MGRGAAVRKVCCGLDRLVQWVPHPLCMILSVLFQHLSKAITGGRVLDFNSMVIKDILLRGMILSGTHCNTAGSVPTQAQGHV